MPTFYLLRSGHLERRGLKVEEVSVPSGNLTMQQMVARRVDVGYRLSRETFATALAGVEVDPGFPADLRPYLQETAEGLLKEKRIAAVPDWNQALRREFMERARS